MESEAALRAAEALSEFDMKKAVSAMVRFALFCHTRKALIRKEDLTRHAGRQSKAFIVIFNKANEYLERVFSMKMLSFVEKKSWIMISTLSDKSLLNCEPSNILIMIILAIIFGSDHSITHDTLVRTLTELGLDDSIINEECMNMSSIDTYLALLVKQNYLNRETSPDFESPLYSWGPRAKVEVPPESLIGFITSIFDFDSDSKEKLTKELMQRIQGQQFS